MLKKPEWINAALLRKCELEKSLMTENVKKTRVSDLFRNNFRFYNNNNSVDLVRE
jgi:hypothetical protein